MKKTLTVIKIGGQVIDDAAALQLFLNSFARLEGAKILVHGGGKLATQMADQLNIPQQIIDGRRVTDEATLKIVTMVYAGYINKTIVAGLQAGACNAIGLSGADGNLIQAHKRAGSAHDYGFAGDVDHVNNKLLQQLLDAEYSPVIAPVTHNKQGQLLNTNADTMAQEIARALSGDYNVKLIYCFEKSGVLSDVADDKSRIATMNPKRFAELSAEGVIHSGMLPKLHNAFTALDRGVQTVIIGKWDQLSDLVNGIAGTTIIYD